MMNAPTQQEIKAILHYDPATGVFTWIARRRFSSVPLGGVAGTPDKNGYCVIQIGPRKHKAHRMAWLYMTGEWPAAQIDHRNGAHADNRWDNLRAATNALNTENKRKARKDNATGLLGVHQKGGRYTAQIQVGGKKLFLGNYSTPELAHAAYLHAKRSLHSGCTI